MTAPIRFITSALVTAEEFTLLGALSSGAPLTPVMAPVDERAAAAAFDALVERGLLVAAGDAHAVPAEARTVIGPFVAPDLAITAVAPGRPARLDLLLGDGRAIGYGARADGVVALVAAEADEIDASLVELYSLDRETAGDCSGDPVDIPFDHLAVFLETLAGAGATAAAERWPAYAEYAAAIVADPAPNTVEVRQPDGDDDTASLSLTWIDGGDHGCWTQLPTEAGVRIRRISRAELLAEIRNAISIAGS